MNTNRDPRTKNRELFLPVARRATRELLNLIFGNEPPAELLLVRRRAIVDVENGVARPDVALRVSMAVEAPFHLERLLLPHQRHAIHLAMAGRAADALLHMDAVVEVHEVGEIVDAGPLDGGVGAEARAHRFEKRAVRKNLGVA